MNYVKIVDDAVQYIESNLTNQFTLEELASRYFISPTHFYRIFRAVMNQTVKSYILERKLSVAAIALRETDLKVVDIAFQFGFNSHEQFTRDFRNRFHVSPSSYRKINTDIPVYRTTDIVERSFKNKNKDIIVDCYCQEIEEIELLGKEFCHNPECSNEIDQLILKVGGFYEEQIIRGSASQLFTVNNSDSNDLSRKSCFYGIPLSQYSGDWSGLEKRTIPKSLYAVFVYPRFMATIFRIVLKDIDKWNLLSGFKFDENAGLDFIELFSRDYEMTGKFNLYIPVLKRGEI